MEHFHLYTGNSLEILADRMMEVLGGPPSGGVFTPERFVVQSRGMELWLSQQIARRRGICANVRFEYPDAFLQSIYREIPNLARYDQEESGWKRETLAWIIMRVLPGLLEDPRFRIVRTYLQMENGSGLDELKLFQLSVRIADVFDQYMIFRPERVAKWEESEAGEEGDALWQAVLWRAIAEDAYGGRFHRARIQRELVRYFHGTRTVPPSYPERITIFGVSYLPQYYIEVLVALSKHIDVYYFSLNPSPDYWYDVPTPREQRTLAHDGQEESVFVGNALLASLGVQGRNFFELLLANDIATSEAGFAEPPTDTLLHSIQHDIFSYRDVHSDPGIKHPPIAADDRSVMVHNCHSRLREMEVLHDHITSMLESDLSLEPGDILVMAPAIEEYAPYIEAVFGSGRARRIPFTIADRPVKSEYTIAQAFMTLLHFSRTRFAASSVLELLEYDHIQAKFALAKTEVETIRRWITDVRIRWGLDRSDTASRYKLPIDDVNTWRYGLSRMLLGYAFPSNGGTRMMGPLLPFDNIEGSDAATLGKLLAFFNRLAALESELRMKRPLAEWGRVLQQAAANFFEMEYEDSCVITPAIGELALLEERSGFDAGVDVQTVIDVLNGAFMQESRAQRFLKGGVTFCSLLPMRSIPARVVCLVGMNSGEFPRRTQKVGFDEMVRTPKKGDRSKRNDDRYMFLEAILSAKDRLYISYCGQNQRDNAVIPPSVAVSELLDYVENNFPEFDPRRTRDGAARSLTIHHKLQPFNPVYFPDGGTREQPYFSYSKRYARAAAAVVQSEEHARPFVERPLPEPERTEDGAELSGFIRFFANPAEHFLRRRLQVVLHRPEDAIDDSEVFTMNSLDLYKLKQELLQAKLCGRAIRE
ncbi:MAG: exodeoxyribonuclease V subunit gamma, partial [Acidobacteriota bacterium]